jgi:hypothetical protein
MLARETTLLEHSKVLRDGGLRNAVVGVELAHCLLTETKALKEGEPRPSPRAFINSGCIDDIQAFTYSLSRRSSVPEICMQPRGCLFWMRRCRHGV